MSISRIPVVSSSIAAVGYSAADAALDIEFVRGTLYRYFAVPRETYDALVSAESIGAYFNRGVRPYFRCTRVREPRTSETNADSMSDLADPFDFSFSSLI